MCRAAGRDAGAAHQDAAAAQREAHATDVTVTLLLRDVYQMICINK